MFGLDSRVATCKGVRGGPEAMVLELEPDALVLEPEAVSLVSGMLLSVRVFVWAKLD